MVGGGIEHRFFDGLSARLEYLYGDFGNEDFSLDDGQGNGGTLDLNGTSGVYERITLNGTGVGGNGALINSNPSTAASIANGVAAISVAPGSGYGLGTTVTIGGIGSTRYYDSTALRSRRARSRPG